MGQQDDKASCHAMKKLLPLLSVTGGCRSDEGPGNVVGHSLWFLLERFLGALPNTDSLLTEWR